MSTCLVTGGAGFLGSHLCDELLSRGHRVICVDNFETGTLANIEHIRTDDFVHLNVDIIEPYFVDERVDFVYHLASPASPIDYLRLPLHTLKVGSYGTHHTLGLAKKHRARFLIASTSEVYGDPQVHPQQETYWGHVNPIGPRGVYRSEEHTSELQSHVISYAVFCLKKKKKHAVGLVQAVISGGMQGGAAGVNMMHWNSGVATLSAPYGAMLGSLEKLLIARASVGTAW